MAPLLCVHRAPREGDAAALESRKHCSWVRAFAPPPRRPSRAHPLFWHVPRADNALPTHVHETEETPAGRYTEAHCPRQREKRGDGPRLRWVVAITAENSGLLRGVVLGPIGDRNLHPQSTASPTCRDATRSSCRRQRGRRLSAPSAVLLSPEDTPYHRQKESLFCCFPSVCVVRYLLLLSLFFFLTPLFLVYVEEERGALQTFLGSSLKR